MTNEKPEFEELTTMNLPDVGLRFNAQRVGPFGFHGLRKINYYGKGFRMPTMPELVPLIYASLEYKNYDTAKNVVKTLKKDQIAGNTGILYIPKGMFVQDNPELKDGRISMNQEVLEKKLGSHEERGVVFSNDNSIRFTPYNFKRKSQTPLELSTNTGIIALVSGEENAEKLAKASECYRNKPDFWTLENVDSPVTKVANLGSDFFVGRWFIVNADDHENSNRYSFGVQKIKQEADLKK
jgi:hypothetical protein